MLERRAAAARPRGARVRTRCRLKAAARNRFVRKREAAELADRAGRRAEGSATGRAPWGRRAVHRREHNLPNRASGGVVCNCRLNSAADSDDAVAARDEEDFARTKVSASLRASGRRSGRRGVRRGARNFFWRCKQRRLKRVQRSLLGAAPLRAGGHLPFEDHHQHALCRGQGERESVCVCVCV